MQRNKLKIVIGIIVILLLLLNLNITYAAGIDDADWIFEKLKENAQQSSEISGKTYAQSLQVIKDNIVATNQLEVLAGSAPTKELREELNRRIDAEIARFNSGTEAPEVPTGLTQDQKRTIENNVNNWINSNKGASNYKELLQQQINLTPSGYTELELEYRKSLYQAEYDSEEENGWKYGGSKQHGALGTSTPNGSHTIDEVLNEAQGFINAGKDSNRGTISTNQLQAGSNTLYNILLSIGVFLAVAVGMYLAIKFMLSSVDDKAKVKEALVPYIAGCVVIFGAFVIWKLAITLLSGIA